MKTPSNLSLKRAKVDNATLERGQATLPNLQITVRPLEFSHSLYRDVALTLLAIFPPSWVLGAMKRELTKHKRKNTH